MKDSILEIIKSSNGKITTSGIANKIQLDEENLNKILKELKLDGKILQISNRYYIFPDDMHIGNVSITHSGNKGIFFDGNMIPLASNFFDNVILNDVVSFYVNDCGEAEITSIIDRKIHDVTCKVITSGKKKKLECFYRGVDVTLPDKILDNFKDGDIILVNIGINNEDSHHCECTFKEYKGHESDPNIDEVIIAANYGYTNDYSNEYLDEVNSIDATITDEEIAKRRDYRKLPFVTIDCATAKDMDDGVYGYKLKNGGYRVYVTIADVSHYVKLFTEIFKRAYELGNSCYINNTVFHMLHPILSNGICSLNPGEDKLTKTVVMDIDSNGNIVDYDICKSVIRSRKKMDYPSVDKILVDGEIPSGYEEYEKMIRDLYDAALALEKRAIEKDGRTDFPSSENVKEYDEFGNVVNVIDDKYESTPSEKLIEHLMIAANSCVAKYIITCCMPSCYRNHLNPSLQKINLGIRTINENLDDNKHKIKMIDSTKHPSAIQGILKKLASMEDEYPIFASLLLQHMERADYGTGNLGHYALGLSEYTHFTSPIRRLCDLLVHMVLDALLGDYELFEKMDFEQLEEFLGEACKQASRMERQAEAAEYEGDRLAILKSMQSHIGEEYDAVVLDVGDRIRLKVNGVGCFIRYKNLSDEFNYDEDNGKFYDKNNNEYLKLGSRVKVKLTDINLNIRSIDVIILGVIDSKKKIKK